MRTISVLQRSHSSLSLALYLGICARPESEARRRQHLSLALYLGICARSALAVRVITFR